MYGYENWNITQAMQECLGAAEIWFIKRMPTISWMEWMINEAVLRKQIQEKPWVTSRGTQGGGAPC